MSKLAPLRTDMGSWGFLRERSEEDLLAIDAILIRQTDTTPLLALTHVIRPRPDILVITIIYSAQGIT